MQRGTAGTNGTITFSDVSAEDSVVPHSRDTISDFFTAPCGEQQYFRVASRISLSDDDADDYDNRWSDYSRHKVAPLCKAPAPTNLSVSSRTTYTRTISWSSRSGVDGFRIERSLAGASSWQVISESISPSSRSYTDTSATCGRDFDYRVSADGDGTSYTSGYGDLSTVLKASGSDVSACPAITIERPKDSNHRTIYRIFEGTDATFTVKSNKSVNRDLTVRILVGDDGDVVSGTPPPSFTFPEDSTSATLTIPTDDDNRRDGAGKITVTLVDNDIRNDYNLGSDPSTNLIIDDNDLLEPEIPGNPRIERVFEDQMTENPVDLVRFSHNEVTYARNYVVQRGTSSDPSHSSFTSISPYRQTQPEGASSRSLFTSDVYIAPCDTESYFRVATEGDGEDRLYARGSFSTPLKAPPCKAPAVTDFAVTDNSVTDSTITLQWSKLTNATHYQVDKWDSEQERWIPVGGQIASPDTGTTVTHTVTPLPCNTRFSFSVRARGDGMNNSYPTDWGRRSATRSATTEQCRVVSIATPMPAATPAPAHPQSDHRIFEGNDATFILTADEAFGSDTTVAISTTSSNAAVDGTSPTSVTFLAGTDTYRLTMATADNDNDTGRGSITVTLVAAGANALPGYRLSSDNGAATLTIDDDDLVLPDPPRNLSVTPTSETYTVQEVPVTIAYDTVDGADIYQVERRLQGATDWSYVDTSTAVTVTCASTYEFQVKAFGDGESKRADLGNPSSTLTVTIECPRAPAPTGLRVSSTDKYSLTLRWSSVPNAAMYKLERETIITDAWVSAGTGADAITGLTYTVTGLQCGTSYSFRVSANGDGQPYSTTFGDPFTLPNDEETDACPAVSISIPSFTPTNLSPVRNYRIFEGDTATFTLTTAERFPQDVNVNIVVAHAGVDITGAVPATITFPANSKTTTFSFNTVDNNSDPTDDDDGDDGRKLITVTLEDGTGYDVSDDDESSIPVDDDDLDPAPSPDATIAPSQPNPTSVRINLTRGTNISSYRVEKRLPQSEDPAEQQWRFAFRYTILARSLSLTASTTCGLPHEYRVIPVGDGERYLLDDGTASATLSYTGDCPAVDAPTGLRSGTTTEYSVSLAWTSVYGVEFYKIERSADGQTGWALVSAQEDTLAAPATNYTATGLACGVDHYFRISARGDGSPRLETYGDASAVLGPVTTEDCPTVSIAPGTTPIFEGSDVTFTVSLDPAVGVDLPISITASQEGNFVTPTAPASVRIPANRTTQTLRIATIDDSVGEPRGSYTVTIAANTDLYSIDSDALPATITIEDDDLPEAPPPADLAVVAVTTTPTFYRAEWTRANDVAQYQVEYRISGKGAWSTFGSYTIRSTVGVPNSLLCGTTYEFRARAKGDGLTTLARFGSWLNPPLSFTSLDCLDVPAPINLTASNRALTSIDFSWSPVVGAVEYKFEHRLKTSDRWEEVLIAAPGVSSNAITPTGATSPSTTLSNLACRTNYSVRVSARGNGRLYSSEFGDTSDILESSTERDYTTCADRTPSFGSETISNLKLTADEAMSTVKLPEAADGDAPLVYSVSPALPAGLTFDAAEREITGTPTLTSCGATFTYTVTDADPTDPDTDTISFTITVLSQDHQDLAFLDDTIDDWTYSVTTNSTALQLPKATGGFGPLVYSISPALPAGLTFDANKLLIYGVPTSTHAAREYTFTVSNRADCANTDSDSITFSIDVPDPPSHPSSTIRPTGLTATGNNENGTITLEWNTDDNAGYEILQWSGFSFRSRPVPSASLTLTCDGKIATICPPDATSAVVSGYTASIPHSHRIWGHNGRTDTHGWSSFTELRLSITDPVPTFNDATVDDQVFIKDREIDPVTLPIAVGGNGRLDYTLTPDLPAGLSFNAATRTISGEPTAATAAATYTLTVTDSDTSNPDTDTITFKLEVLDDDPVVEISGLTSPVYEGQEISFTVTGSNIPTVSSYEVQVNAYAGENGEQSTTNSDLGFNSTCSDVEESDDVTTGASSHTATFTLHICDSEYNGGIVTAVLVDDDDNVLAGDWFAVEAKPITVRIEADNPFPVTTGDADDREVTLTATVDGPTGTTYDYYHWQTPALDDEVCTSVQNATSATHDLSSTTATTMSVRVIVKENSTDTDCYISEPLYIAWDLGATLREITDALAANFDRPSTPTGGGKSDSTPRVPVLPAHQTALHTAESSLLTCAGITDGSFASLMTQYTGDTKALLDSGNCRTQANTMWTALETSFSTTLTNIRTTGTNAAAINAFLASEPGQAFVTYMTDNDQLKGSIESFIVPAANILANEPAASEPDDQGNPAGDSGQDRTTRGEDTEGQESGLSCIPAQGTPDAAAGASLSTRLRVLNCLLFATPWTFWLDLADDSDTSSLTAYDARAGAVPWLYRGDLICTIDWRVRWAFFLESEPELAACLKHDVTWPTLAQAINPHEDPRDGYPEVDSMWNPRNKYLADIIFLVDNVCDQLAERSECLSSNDSLWTATLNAYIFKHPADWARYWGVSYALDTNYPVIGPQRFSQWPLTTLEDTTHVANNRYFIECANPIPNSTTGLTVSADQLSDYPRAIWEHRPTSCTGSSALWMLLCYRYGHSSGGYLKEQCTVPTSGTAELTRPTYEAPGIQLDRIWVTRVIMMPNNRRFGPATYDVPINYYYSEETDF